VVQDALGQDWFCVETALAEIPGDGGGSFADVLRAQELAHKHGLSVEGSALRLILAPDVEALARELVLETYPSVEESGRRLREAGWGQDVREHSGTGRKVRVSVSNGRQTIEAEGDNAAEAWHRAAQRALQEKSPMRPPIQPDPVPLRADEGGALRVGDTRVPLDTVIYEYENGADPEGIVNAYPTLQLADVYAVIAYYLRHQAEVNEYVRKRQAEAAELRREIQGRQPSRGELRAKLLARRDRQEQGHASARS
jgi:uncharacterized protein (DUF433 family)